MLHANRKGDKKIMSIEKSYELAKETYAEIGVDTDTVMSQLDEISISMHCWQGDDVTGLEGKGALSGGGILATGSYPGKPRDGDELRQDIDKAMSLIPGKHRLNLHASYAETGGETVERDCIEEKHFSRWIDWARVRDIGLDFNPTFFSHRLAESGFTLASRDRNVREFWIRHAQRCRQIAAHMGRMMGTPCINNIWIPDGFKDLPANRMEYRQNLKESLDRIISIDYDKKHLIDSVECKLFGIGSEAYVVGSHEFYLGYAAEKGTALCLDVGHFHPTERINDKISSTLMYCNELLLHISRGVRWDSDHVVILNDHVISIAQEVKRCNVFDRVHFALDFFDASINRIIAWVVGTRAALKGILFALLENSDMLLREEHQGNYGNRLALMEEFKTLPFGAVWNMYCESRGVPCGMKWLESVHKYEEQILSKRN